MSKRPVGKPRSYAPVLCPKCGTEVGATTLSKHIKVCDGVRKEE